ncbi:hypothetical protein Despr_3196 [Desulfobulbus propionicus DSM 2032]|uniref:Uncharacterized protein n=1 Tax=Desulfobulbus propionicus (strain ATCC 33891 / DSM 2032 / VKM B-1956 / 1pr3) TaxID=577650 RepID=A0A7U3YPU7_DESPD|nr:hypothetical protein [Desulfobulbus propionicus]ADW19324.1 hypothetical protein Despr_3196 [Desulfobulbus propionicus DSM 2032]
MSWQLKTILLIMMTTALACGFLHHLVPPSVLNFERLHIFLFNLCSGGTLLVYFTEGKPSLSHRGQAFLILALAFALCAFFHWYVPTLIIPLLLAALIEQVRVDHFGSRFPRALFSPREPVPRKFHQAALLCLSLGLSFSSPVILNSVYLQWFAIEKLKLDTFFLGFSFPISLISMSVIFTLMKREAVRLTALLKEAAFWIINLGVIVFFGFILAGLFASQVAIATLLFLTVGLILYLYWYEGMPLQQKAFLTSGILFLLITSITGIAYILLSFSSYYTPEHSVPLLRLHAFTALYGWNLSGLAVISRHGDFPLKLHSRPVILLHWLTVLVLCPLGYFFPWVAILAVLAYGGLLIRLFFNKGTVDRQLTAVQQAALATDPAANRTN